MNEVLAFQKLDEKLTDDGLWGPNAQKAAGWYLQTTSVPGVIAKFASTKVTWTPPSLETETKTVQPKAEIYTQPAKLSESKTPPKPSPTPAKPKPAPAKPASKPAPVIRTAAVPRAKKPVTASSKEVATKPTKPVAKPATKPAAKPAKPAAVANKTLDFEAVVASTSMPSGDSTLDQALALLQKHDLQITATDEHNRIVAEDMFRDNVLTGLKNIKDTLSAKGSKMDRKFLALFV